jgi:hypothetical protein
MLVWDGLQFPHAEAMEVVELHRGYVRLAGEEQSLELRFGPEKRPFEPQRDGRRLQQGAGLAATGLDLCTLPEYVSLTGTLYGGGRLYVYRLVGGGVAALLYSRDKAVEEVVQHVAAMQWTAEDRRRQWRCLDLAFVSPPQMTLQKARFAPGTFTVDLKKGRTVVTLVRLVPADIVLGGRGLAEVAPHLVNSIVKGGLEVISGDNDTLDFHRRGWVPAPLKPLFSWFGQGFRGRIRHDRDTNRLLLVVERGRPLPSDDYKTIVHSYVAVNQG